MIREFTQKLNEKEEFEHFGEHLITIVEQTESVYKARIIGALFSALIQNRIDRDAFEFLCFAVSRSFIHNLYQLHYATTNPNILDEKLGACLAALRLVDTKIEVSLKVDKMGLITKEAEMGIPEVKNSYKINHYGSLLADEVGGVIARQI